MKKLSKILLLVLSLALVLGVFAIAASADNEPFYVDNLPRATWEEAVANADENTAINLARDYTVGSTLAIEKSLTVNLGGKTLTASADVFEVTGSGVSVNIVGPGTIVTGGKALTVGEGATVDISGGVAITSTATTSTVLIPVSGKLSISGDLAIVTDVTQTSWIKGIEVANGAELRMNGANVSMVPSKLNASSIADTYSNIVIDVGAAALAEGIDSTIEVVHGKILSALGTTSELAPATMSFLRSTLKATDPYGTGSASVIYQSNNYASINFTNSNVISGGRAISGNLMDLSQPTKTTIKWTDTNYSIPQDTLYGSPRLFCDGVSAEVDGGIIDLSFGSSALTQFTIRVKLWDGTSGVIIREGTRFTAKPVSELAGPVVDGDTTLYYSTAEGAYNCNFSLEVVNEVNYVFVSDTVVNKDHTLESYYTVSHPRAEIVFPAGYTTNYNSDALGDYDTLESVPATVSKGWGGRYGETHIKESADGSNRYVQFMYDASKFTSYPGYDKDSGKYSTGAYYGIELGPITSNHPNPTYKYDFITIDFDIASHVETSSGKVSYGYYGMTLFQRDGVNQHQTHSSAVSISGAKLYVGSNSASLSETPGVWNHITYLIEVDNSTVTDAGGNITAYNLSNSKLHVYVEGKYVGTTSILKDTANDPKLVAGIGLDELRFGLSYPSASTASYGISFDNLAVAYYSDGYVGNISQLVTDTEKKLYECNDVVYNESYQYPTPNVPVASVDGENYYNEFGVINNIKEGSQVILYSDLATPIPELAFTIKTNGHSFTNTSQDYYTYQDEEISDLWYVAKANEKVVIIWDPDDKFGLFAETEGTLNSIPTHPETIGDIVDTENNKMQVFLGWSYEDYGMTEADEILPITKKDISDEEICLYPVFVESNIAYSIKNELTGKISYYSEVPEDGKELAAQLSSATASDGSVVTFVLYSDIHVHTWTAVAMKGTLNMDLNGHVFAFTNYGASANRMTIFNGTDSTWFNLYSTKEGGRFINYTYYTANAAISSGAVLGGGNANFGKYVNETYGINAENGDYLTVESANLVDHYGQSISTDNIEKDQNYTIVNINGGTYRRSYSDSMGLLIVRKWMKIDIKGANLIADRAPIIAVDPRYASRATVTVDDSYVYANGSVFGNFMEGSSISFTDTVIQGNIKPSAASYKQSDYKYLDASLIDERNADTVRGEIIFGAGTVLAAENTVEAENFKIADGCIKVGTSAVETVVFPKRTVVFDKMADESYVCNASSFVYEDYTKTVTPQYKIFTEGGSGYATVRWLGYNDELIEEQFYIVGSTAIYDTTNIPKIMLNNGWYDLAFSSWDAEDLTISEAKTYEFRANYGPVANFTKTKMNMTLMSYYTVNVYAPLENLPEGVDNVQWALDANGTSAVPDWRTDEFLIKGERYTAIYSYPGAYQDSNVGQYIRFTVNGVWCSQWVTVKVGPYLEHILTREGATDAEKALAIECMRYNEATIRYHEFIGIGASSVAPDATVEMYRKYLADPAYNKYLNDLETISDKFTEAEKNVDYSELSEYIDSASLVFAHKSGFVFVPKEGYTPHGSVKAGVLSVRASYTDIGTGKGITAAPTVITVDGKQALACVETRMYSLRQPISVKAYYDGSWTAVASGTYSLAAYITGVETLIASGELDEATKADYEKGLELSKILYSFSIASENYIKSK